MSKFRVFLLVLIFILCVGKSGFSAPVVTSAQLIENGDWDNKIVCYSGEAIAVKLKTRNGVWLNVLDTQSAIGVFAPRELTDKVKFLGKYSEQGDQVRVTGVFHKNCIEHAGDLDIHALDIEVIASGYPLAHPVSETKIKMLIASLLSVFLSIILVVFGKKNG